MGEVITMGCRVLDSRYYFRILDNFIYLEWLYSNIETIENWVPRSPPLSDDDWCLENMTRALSFWWWTFQIKCLIILQRCNLPGKIFSLCDGLMLCPLLPVCHCKGWWWCVSVRASPVSFSRIMTGVSIVQLSVRLRGRQKLSSWHWTLTVHDTRP